MPENSLSRRSLAKTAAWSVPVVAVAIATPAAAASNATVDIVVSRACRTLTLGGSVPRFTVSAVTGNIPAGTTFTLSSPRLANVSVSAAGATVGVLVNNTITFTIATATPSAIIDITGVLGVFAVAEFRLSLASVPAGFTETNTGNNTAAANLTGLSASPLTGFLGVCLGI
ncbi:MULTISPECIES: hypothetical protein [unclassified Rathayibacter]|uniref:hypothetical protein n=1 Tax=unclassified Rathayibacter TaxID=2609250 RepID=UPI000F4BD064|nr:MULTISPECIES: hypothetical protein [unclassified Rathayibacter]MCJ1702983.1 hypothetical protein [Rathayibacter sp. VKM Ac-2926]ROP45117.1 hypothetical protein EDF45_3635 [Rathayibacter sp. PhB186]ROS47846.1 hypothetical protein EDF44_3679 [Rathayibacter sp. PhB185]TCL81827.1 hypothetical protein EDF49_107188 [Rathayibacter sp. PhB192]TCM26836.1 hypothetical protein EDF43_107188 [Rathayibacter sp. PhB179]